MLNSFGWYSSYAHVSFLDLVVFLEMTFKSLTSSGGFLEDLVFTQTLSLSVTTSLVELLNHYVLHPDVEGTCLSLH